MSDSRVAYPLFVAVNSGCNMTCWYCTENGENRSTIHGRLSQPRLRQLLEAAHESGVRTFRFTGGEPTLRRSLGEILRSAQDLGDDVEIALTTNGARLDALLTDLAHLREPQVFLSVDGFAPEGSAPSQDREFRIEKWLTPRLMRIVDELSSIARVRLNFVLTASSVEQLPALIGYASANRLDVKIFELLYRDFFYAGHRPRREVFREQYLSVRSLLPELVSCYGEPRPFAGTGGRGIPMRAFDTEGSRIIYFDSSVGSHYGEVCASCPHHPCQEGLYALVLDANGVLHPAGCTNRKLHVPLGIADRPRVMEGFERLQREIAESTFQRVVPDYIPVKKVTA